MRFTKKDAANFWCPMDGRQDMDRAHCIADKCACWMWPADARLVQRAFLTAKNVAKIIGEDEAKISGMSEDDKADWLESVCNHPAVVKHAFDNPPPGEGFAIDGPIELGEDDLWNTLVITYTRDEDLERIGYCGLVRMA